MNGIIRIISNIILIIKNVNGPDEYIYYIMAIEFILYIAVTEMLKIKADLLSRNKRLLDLLHSDFTFDIRLFFLKGGQTRLNGGRECTSFNGFHQIIDCPLFASEFLLQTVNLPFTSQFFFILCFL